MELMKGALETSSGSNEQLKVNETLRETAEPNETAEMTQEDWTRLAVKELTENGESDAFHEYVGKVIGALEADPELGSSRGSDKLYDGKTAWEWGQQALFAKKHGWSVLEDECSTNALMALTLGTKVGEQMFPWFNHVMKDIKP